MSLPSRSKPMIRAIKYDNLADIEQTLSAVFRDASLEFEELKNISTRDEMLRAIRALGIFPEHNISSCNARVDGMAQCIANLVAYAGSVIEQPELLNHPQWQSMLWAGMVMFFKVLHSRNYNVEQGLGLAEVLIVESDLLCLKVPGAQCTRDTRSRVIHIIAEIVITLGETVAMVWKAGRQPSRQNPRHNPLQQPLVSTQIGHSEIERFRKTSDRISRFAKSMALTPTKNSAMDTAIKLKVPYSNITEDMLSSRFYGRDDFLLRMKSALQLGSRSQNFHLALHGLPGVGKSQLALRYAQKFKQDYDIIIWTTAVTQQKIRETLARAAHNIGIPGAKLENDINERAQNMLSWLETTDQRWLLIFDNVDDTEVLKDFRVPSDNGHNLITSRDPKSGTRPVREGIPVTAFSSDDAKDFFFSNISGAAGWKQGSEQVGTLLKEWDGLPMALDQMSSYIRETRIPFKAFAAKYEKHRRRIHGIHSDYAREWGYTNTTATAFSIHHLQDDARRLLHAMSFLDPDNVFDEADLEDEGQSVLLKIFPDSMSYFEALEELLRRSLLQKDARGLKVHRLVQAVSFDDMDPDNRHEMFECLLRLVRAIYSQSTMGSSLRDIWESCDRYYSHVNYLLEKWKQVQDQPTPGEQICLQELIVACTWYMFERGYFSEADRLLQKADALVKGDETFSASCKFSLAGVRNECNRIAEAKVLVDEVVTIHERALLPEDPTLATTYYSAGIVYMESGDLATALRFHEKALKVLELANDTDETQAVATHVNLSYCYARMHDVEKATEHAKKALDLSSRSGKPSDHYAEALFNMGNICLSKNEPDEAFKLHQQALDCRIAVMPTHDKAGYSFHKMASLHEAKGNFSEALEMLDLAIGIFERGFDWEPRVARSQYRKAMVLKKLGEHVASENARNEALRLRSSITHFPVQIEETDEAFDALICSWFR